jgi:hypothetical protein
MNKRKFGRPFVVLAVFGVILAFSFLRVYLRLQTTLLAYELGDLKERENSLIDSRSKLQVELAKLTSQSQLLLLSHEPKRGNTLETFAAQ